jgi:hypothetical protein
MTEFGSRWAIKWSIYMLLSFRLVDKGVCFVMPTLRFQCTRANEFPHTRKSCYAGSFCDNIPHSEKQAVVEELILSLSNDSDDESRRSKVARLFDEQVQSLDGGELFMKLFDSAMIVVGDRIRADAVNGVAARTNCSTDIDDSKLPYFPLNQQEKSNIERQLWACVDMMVQSKTLMKRVKITQK